MIEVRLHGNLKKFGESFRLDIKSVPEAIEALCQTIPDFRRVFLTYDYSFYVDETNIFEDELDWIPKRSIDIVPVVQGSVIAEIITAVVLAFKAMTVTSVLTSIATSLVIAGGTALISKLLSPQAEEAGRQQNFDSSISAKNYGEPIPLWYGETFEDLGEPISASIIDESNHVIVSPNSTSWNLTQYNVTQAPPNQLTSNLTSTYIKGRIYTR